MVNEDGDCEFAHCDDANIPVDIWLRPDESMPGMWVLRASNYMPRKGMVQDSAYRATSENIQELQQLIKDKIMPLYALAVGQLANMATASVATMKAETAPHLYYWH